MNVSDPATAETYRSVIDRLRRGPELRGRLDEDVPTTTAADFGLRARRDERRLLSTLLAGGAERQLVPAPSRPAGADRRGPRWVLGGPPVRRPDQTAEMFLRALARRFRLDGVRLPAQELQARDRPPRLSGWVPGGVPYATVVGWVSTMARRPTGERSDLVTYADELGMGWVLVPFPVGDEDDLTQFWARAIGPVLGLMLAAADVETAVVVRRARSARTWPSPLTSEWLGGFFRRSSDLVRDLGGTSPP